MNWQLVMPGLLHDEVSISWPEHIKLVIVAAEGLYLDNTFILDVIKSFCLQKNNVCRIRPEQLDKVTGLVVYWLLGTKLVSNKEHIITSPILEELCDDVCARRALWNDVRLYVRNKSFIIN
jgi:DNA polymerase III psi subunit